MAEKIIREYRGIRDLVAAELLVDTLSELTYDTPFPIAGIAELSRTTENSSESHYYDNIAAIVIDSVGADEVTCSCSAIPLDVLAKLTGQYYDSVTKTFVECEGTKKYFAIGYVTEDTDGNEIYVWRHKVKCSIPDSTHSTKNDGTDANGQEIVFTGISTIHKFTKTGKPAKAVNHEANSGTILETDFFAHAQTIDTLTQSSPLAPATVTFSPVSGTALTSEDTVTMACATSGATIQYVLSVPDAPQPGTATWFTYNGPIHLTQSAKIWARASKDGAYSTTTTGVYTIS